MITAKKFTEFLQKTLEFFETLESNKSYQHLKNEELMRQFKEAEDADTEILLGDDDTEDDRTVELNRIIDVIYTAFYALKTEVSRSSFEFQRACYTDTSKYLPGSLDGLGSTAKFLRTVADKLDLNSVEIEDLAPRLESTKSDLLSLQSRITPLLTRAETPTAPTPTGGGASPRRSGSPASSSASPTMQSFFKRLAARKAESTPTPRSSSPENGGP